MEILRINSHATAFIRPDEGANVGLIHTPKGMILIDTTSAPADIKSLFDDLHAHIDEVVLVINTHSHSDHTWGNQHFNCPILAHRSCQERMQAALQDEWSPDELQAYLAEVEKSDPKRAESIRRTLQDLHITLPTQTFEERFIGVLGGVKYEVIHLDGHTPDLSVVWLPESEVLFASDLIFQGRYPYIFDADIPTWIARLNSLLEFRAEVVIPGHGVRCGEAEMVAMREYLQATWDLTAEHIRLGHSLEQTLNDQAYPIFTGKLYERLHQANIRYVFEQLMAGNH